MTLEPSDFADAVAGDVAGECSGRLVGERLATLRPMLAFRNGTFAEMIGHAYDGYPLEACGLLVGSGERVERFVACTNEAAPARTYSIPAQQLLRAERDAEEGGLEIIGVFHSHTHTEPYPSPTDVD